MATNELQRLSLASGQALNGDASAHAPAARSAPPPRSPGPLVIIVDRASAGLERLLNELAERPDSTYLVYLVVEPLKQPELPNAPSPSGPRVVYAESGQRLQRGETLLLPGNLTWALEGNQLFTSSDEQVRRAPLTSLLRSVARQHREKLVVAVLGGVDADSSEGLRKVRECGGLVLALEGQGLVEDQLSTDAPVADQLVSRDQLFPRLFSLIDRLERKENEAEAQAPVQRLDASLDHILETLRTRTGHDLRQYNRRTLLRRLQRRMHATQLEGVEAYSSYLQCTPEEPELLARDLLIGVTQFFRDPAAFEYLGTCVIPRILLHKAAGGSLRLWVPACASGEEAYSLAVLFTDHIEQHGLDIKLQIFATDIDQESLNAAREGTYPLAVEAQIPRPLLERYFVGASDSYRVAKRIRDCVIFSPHNVFTDPPFAKLDLISCRNLLVYLSTDLQRQLLPIFHYALGAGGYLLLGATEGLGSCRHLFSELHKQHRIFQRREIPLGNSPRPRLSAGPRRSEAPQLRARPSPTAPAAAPSVPAPLVPASMVPSMVERALLEAYALACVVIDQKLDIVYFVGDTSRYLRPPEGLPTVNVLEVARLGLRTELRACIRQAIEERRATTRNAGGHSGVPGVQLIVKPMIEQGEAALHLVIFQDLAAMTPSPQPTAPPPGGADVALEQLELELKRTQEQLQVIVREFQASTEDLRASNQQLFSMNEELQSSNEELETTKEELQSANEELESVNFKLSSKLDELAHANSDISNLLENTRIATLFLDDQLRIRNFTPATSELFALIGSDRGRPIAHIAQRFEYEHLQRDIEQVISSLCPHEAQVRSHAGKWFILRILPYRSVRNVIEGAVVTFTDVSALKEAEIDIQRLSTAYERQLLWLQALLAVVPVGIAYYEEGMQGVRLNKVAVEALCLPSEALATRAEPLGFEAWGDGDAGEHAALMRTIRADLPARDVELQLGHGEGARHLVLNSAPLVDTSSATYGLVSAFVDITEIRRARELAVAREQQQAIIADLGLRALEHGNLATFLCEGLKMLCQAAQVDACDVMQLTDSKDALESSCRTGFRQAEPDLREVVVAGSPADVALQSGEPVFFQRSESPEGWPGYLEDEGIQSGVRLAITSFNRQPFGLLGLYTRSPREFSKHDLHFLRAGALVITSAVQRQAIDEARWREREAAALRRSEEQLRRAERLASLGTFAAGIAHELNNPLNNISLAADYAEQSDAADRRQRLLSKIKSNAQRCGQIVESVLRFARDEATERRPVSPASIIRRSVDLVRSEFETERLSVKLGFDDDLPTVYGNSTELEQVFVNLLRNAVEAHPGHCHVEIKAFESGAYLRVCVADDGPGISPKDVPHIFDPFFSTRRKQGGTGLGLSITHRIVTTHSGAIRVARERAQGTAFEIELPLAMEGCESNDVPEKAHVDRRG